MALAKPASADLGDGVGVATPSGPPARRIWEIEIIRGLAAVMVVVVHVASTSGVFPGGAGAGAWWVLGAALPVLFAITGFVLYTIPDSPLPAGSPHELRQFMLRRLLRLVPAYWVALTLLALYPGLPDIAGPGDAVRFLAFAQVYSLPHVFGGIGPAWTLCVDVTLYVLIAALVILGRTRFRPRSDAWLFGGLLAVALAAHVVVGPLLSERLYFRLTHTLVGALDWFLIGVVLALLRRPGVRVPRPVTVALSAPVAWPAALVLAAVHVVALDVQRDSWALIAAPGWAAHVLQTLIAFFVLAPATTPRPIPGGRWRKLVTPLVALGTISYGVYLWHRPVITWLAERELVRDVGLDAGVGLFVVALLVTIPLAMLSWRLVERPAILLSRRLGRGGFRARDADGVVGPPWRPDRSTAAGLALVVTGIVLVAFPAALPEGVLLTLLAAAALVATAAHVATERGGGGGRRFGIAAPLPAFALAFVLVLGVRAVSLISEHDGRYFTGGSDTQLKLASALGRDLPERGPRRAAFDPQPGVQQRVVVRRGSAWVGDAGWRWRVRSSQQVIQVAAGFPDAISALESGPLLVTPREPLGVFASVRVNWRARPPTTIELYTRFFDQQGAFVTDALAARMPLRAGHPRARWRALAGTVEAPERAASAVLLVLVRFPAAGRPQSLDVDGAALVPGVRTTAELPGYLPETSRGVWASALPRALSLAVAMLLCVVGGYLLAGRRGLGLRALPLRLAAPESRSGRRVVLAVLAIGVVGWIWEMSGYGGYGAYLDQLDTVGVTGRGHWYQHAVATLPTGLAVYLAVRLLGEGRRRPRWWEAATILVGALIGVSYLLKTTIAIPVLTALLVLCMRRPRLGLWIIASGVVLAVLTPFVYTVRGAGRIDLGVLLSSSYWDNFLSNFASRFFHFESLMITTRHGAAEPPWRPLAELVQTAIPRALWEGKPDSTAARFTQDYLLTGLHSPTDIGVLSAPGEAYLIGGGAAIVVIGVAIGLLLRVARDLVAAAPNDTAALLVAATITTGAIFLNDGWGIASTIIVLATAQLGWILMVRPRRDDLPRGVLPRGR